VGLDPSASAVPEPDHGGDPNRTDQAADPYLPSRRELQLDAQAIGNRWRLGPSVRRRILQRAVDLCDPETELGAKASPRLILAASKIILAADRLQIEDERLEIARARLGLDKQFNLSELVADAEAAAEAHARDRDADRTSDQPGQADRTIGTVL
jgi:hypothetical protein